MSAATPRGHTPYYFVPAPSRLPVMAATGLFFVIFGAGNWVNGADWGKYSVLFGLLLWAFTMQGWFRQAIGESEGGLYGDRVDTSFRWSMSWFIFSEVMFFGAFFTALWWMRSHSVPALGGTKPCVGCTASSSNLSTAPPSYLSFLLVRSACASSRAFRLGVSGIGAGWLNSGR